MNRPTKSEIIPGLLLTSARFSEVLVLAAPASRGMVQCRVYVSGVERDVTLPVQSLRWQ